MYDLLWLFSSQLCEELARGGYYSCDRSGEWWRGLREKVEANTTSIKVGTVWRANETGYNLGVLWSNRPNLSIRLQN